MPQNDFVSIFPYLEPVELRLRQMLVEPLQRMTHVWFMESGVASVVATTAGGKQSEVGLVGREGLIDVAFINGSDMTPLECFVQITGSAQRLQTAILRELTAASATLRAFLSLYGQNFLIQVAHTALANATHTIDARLARWLLMSHDRIGSDDIQMTHEFLSIMLGVRRAGVTLSVQELERDGLVTARRGSIIIKDRAGLLRLAGDSYGTPEAEFIRLFGFDFRYPSSVVLSPAA